MCLYFWGELFFKKNHSKKIELEQLNESHFFDVYNFISKNMAMDASTCGMIRQTENPPLIWCISC